MRGLTAVVVTTLVACGGGGETTRTDCIDGESRECYGGPDGTAGQGPCLPGLETCSGGRWPGICIGDIVPRPESCNGEDDNCNGTADDGPGVGDECVGSNGCTGARACDAGGSIRCFAPSKNECGLCGGPDITNVGDECVSDQGCVGSFVCTSDMTIAACSTPVPNECGVCGGPAVAGLGVDCTSSDGCAGTVVCSANGDTAVCNAPVFNECGACFPSVGPIGVACTADGGCIGVTSCSPTGDAAMCTADAGCQHLVISEVATDSPTCDTDEYIEIYNPSSRTVSLAGYALRYRSAAGSTYSRLVAFASTASIAPHGFFLVGSARNSATCPGSYAGITANTVAADATFVAVNMAVGGASLWLTSEDRDPTALDDTIVVDVVGYGNANSFETAAVDDPVSGGAIERKATAGSTAASLTIGGAEVAAGNARDTDDNSADFVQQTTRVPQNTQSGAEP